MSEQTLDACYVSSVVTVVPIVTCTGDFDGVNLMDTPEFLIWALEFTCPIRGFQDGSDPERTERQLRAARAYSEASQEFRVFEGLAVDLPNGFRIEEALAIYGGETALRQNCTGCPANALPCMHSDSLAGCYGLLPLPDDATEFHRAIDAACVAPVTKPSWYGLWLDSPIESERLHLLQQVIAAAIPQSELPAGINAAIRTGCRLHARLYPPGRVEGSDWMLALHCPRCKALWSGVRRAVCQVCRYAGHPADDKRRKARGQRPYSPLERLLGKQQAAEFLIRYAAHRAQRALPDLPQSRLLPERPGNPAAD